MEGQTRSLRLTRQQERLAGLGQESNTHVGVGAFSAARTSLEEESEGSTGPQRRGLGRNSSKGLWREITRNVVEKRQDEGGEVLANVGSGGPGENGTGW